VLIAWGKHEKDRYFYLGPLSIWVSTRLRIKLFMWDFTIVETQKLITALKLEQNELNRLYAKVKKLEDEKYENL
jgi:hypothetical protein